MISHQPKADLTGLSSAELRIISDTITRYPEIESCRIFGSRSKGTYKIGSDIDLVISGKLVTSTSLMQLSYELNEESPLPYYFDILDQNKITSETLLEHIKKHSIDLKETLRTKNSKE